VPADVRVEHATASRWDDVVEVFGVRGDPSWCWCRYFVTTGEGYLRATSTNRAALRRDLRADPLRPAGLLAYVDDEPVGWLQLGPRSVFPRVTTNRGVAAVVGADDDETVWRTTCFVVRVGYRRRGVATALLDAAVGFAREHGATRLEGHPVDVAARGGKVAGANLYHGALSTFLAAGFTEVGRTHPSRPVVRRGL
jgi:GNAT superfamily N-acetyltransferase